MTNEMTARRQAECGGEHVVDRAGTANAFKNDCQNCMKNFQDSTPIQFTFEPGSLLVLE
jgi:hypothetical protein